jgi:hypothetical protein
LKSLMRISTCRNWRRPKWRWPMRKEHATNEPKVENVCETIRTSDGQVLILTVSAEPVQLAAREKFPTLKEQMRAHLAKMAEVTNA